MSRRKSKQPSRAANAGVSIAQVKRMATRLLKEARGGLFSIECVVSEADSSIDSLGSELRAALDKWESGVVDVLEYLGEPSGTPE